MPKEEIKTEKPDKLKRFVNSMNKINKDKV